MFLVGMLSLLDALLGMPMERAIEKMALPKAVRQVLIESDGPYARFVLLALAMEKGRTEQMAMLAAQLGIRADILEESRIAAHTWAEQALEFS